VRVASPYDALRALSAELPENAPVARTPDGDWIAASDLARLLSATKFWHGEVRKLDLRTSRHRIQLTADNPFVLIDDRTLQLLRPVRVAGGQLYVPVALIAALPQDSTLTRLIHDARRGLVLRVPPEGLVRTPRIEVTEGRVRLTFPTDQPEDAVVIGRGRAHFRVRFGGLFVGTLPETPAFAGLLRDVRIIPASEGSAFELSVAPQAQGYRVEPSPRGDAVDLVLAREAGSGFERFAPEGPAGPRRLKVIVLDPGHGGDDAGVTAGGAVEKDLTLALARELARELERHLGARVVLTRGDDRDPPMQQRAETANRAHADMVLSLHFDGEPSASARGVTAYCPPATFADTAAPEEGPRPVLMLPWRDVATRHAVRSRELAEAVLSAIDLRGLGPTRLREQLPYPLLGVNAPGLLLECGTLTSDADRARLAGAQGLPDLARAIAAGLDAYRRAE
jgi:N-acetylmuramoyl-L-alanine amidase